jgi:hypothetical protein
MTALRRIVNLRGSLLGAACPSCTSCTSCTRFRDLGYFRVAGRHSLLRIAMFMSIGFVYMHPVYLDRRTIEWRLAGPEHTSTSNWTR